jgi:hypothetical protein
MKSSEIWRQFIDYELSLNNTAFTSLLCYMAVKTPLTDCQSMVDK